MPVKTCPECGADLSGKDPKKHAIAHWGPDYEKIKEVDNPTAYKRIKALVS